MPPSRSAAPPSSWPRPRWVGLAACGGGGDSGGADATGRPVEVQSAGAESGRIQLPGTAGVGQTGSASVLVDISLQVSGIGMDEALPVSLRIDYDSEIVEADDEGYVSESVVTASEVLEAPDGADQDDLGIEDLVGVQVPGGVRPRRDRRGTSSCFDEDDLTDARHAAFDDFGGDLETTWFDYPSEPVGEGATWTAVTEIESEGLEVAVTYHYELNLRRR